MKFSPQQDAALLAVGKWLQEPSSQIYYLAGYAGTGKTTLARHFAESVNGNVLFGAYTGKAAHVLRQKGCPNASTIHSMIYCAREKSRATLQDLGLRLGELMMVLIHRNPDLTPEELGLDEAVIDLRAQIRAERNKLSRPIFELNHDSEVLGAALVIIDECSMVGGKMGEDLLSFGKKVLVLGDPAQLPPVADGGFFTDRIPNTILTEIHRQARDNPIIDLATRTRQEEIVPLGEYGSSRVVEKATPEQALASGQVLVGRNKTRRRINERIRVLKGITEQLPITGDRLVCLRNNHDRGLLNGAIWHVEDVGDYDTERVVMTIRPDMEGEPITVEAHTSYFLGLGDGMAWWERKEAEEFDYGYALTVHKAQGSQWDTVMLWDESDCFRENRWRWLYTGITRAAESITIVRN